MKIDFNKMHWFKWLDMQYFDRVDLSILKITNNKNLKTFHLNKNMVQHIMSQILTIFAT